MEPKQSAIVHLTIWSCSGSTSCHLFLLLTSARNLNNPSYATVNRLVADFLYKNTTAVVVGNKVEKVGLVSG